MPRPLTPESIIYELIGAGDAQISPDASQVLSTWSKADHLASRPNTRLRLNDRDGGNLQLLDTGDVRVSGGRWSPDGASIAFVREKQPGAALCLMSSGGGNLRELTSHIVPIGSLAWSPDGKTLAYSASYDPDNPNEQERSPDAPPRVRVVRRVDYKQDNRGFLNDVRTQVWLVDVASGNRRMITLETVDHLNPAWSPDGAKIATRTPLDNGMHAQLVIVDAENGDRLTIGERIGTVGAWAWSPDSSQLLLAADTAQSWQYDLFLADAKTGELTRLTEDLECQPETGFPTVTPPSQPVWLDNREVLFHAVHKGRSGLWRADTETGNVQLVEESDRLSSGLQADSNNRYFVQTDTTLSSFGEVAVFDLRTSVRTTIVAENEPLLASRPMAASEQFQIERAGVTIDAWLLKPAGFDATKRYPVVLDIHGGPNSFYGFGFNPMQQALAGAGFLVVFSNPRGSASYGRRFTTAVRHDWGGEDYLDLMAVVDAVLERSYADPDRLGVYGYSYGGFMSSWIVGHNDKFKAAVIGAPVVDLVSFYGTADIGHTFGPLQIGGTPATNIEEYRTHSPLYTLDRITCPVLILHGEQDDRVPIGQGEQLFTALVEAGTEVEFVRYPQGSHASVTRTGYPAHRLDFLERLTGWFTRWL